MTNANMNIYLKLFDSKEQIPIIRYSSIENNIIVFADKILL